MQFGIEANMRFPREVLLTRLRTNADAHRQIVEEARAGYLSKAKKAIAERWKALESGKCVSLVFSLSPPRDYSEAYSTVIKMLEMTEDATIELTAMEFRNLVMDVWDWTNDFISSNKHYSAMASKMSGDDAE